MKKLITSLAIATALTGSVLLAGCSSSSEASARSEAGAVKTTGVVTPTPKPSPKPPVLTGTWKSETSDPDSYQEATIAGDVIKINWVGDGGDTQYIYWVGSFTAPTTAESPFKWTSSRDKAATDSALLASTDDTKAFTYDAGVISYSASLQGTTTTVKLHRE